jgi:hypothetical protein
VGRVQRAAFRAVARSRNPTRAITVQVGRGRPKRLLEVGGRSPRFVRFPNAAWERIEARARARGITLHAALREAILAWLERVA